MVVMLPSSTVKYVGAGAPKTGTVPFVVSVSCVGGRTSGRCPIRENERREGARSNSYERRPDVRFGQALIAASEARHSATSRVMPPAPTLPARSSARSLSDASACCGISGRPDSNRRPPRPKRGALPDCATSRDPLRVGIAWPCARRSSRVGGSGRC